MKPLLLKPCTSSNVTDLSLHYGARFTVSNFSANRILRNSLNAGGFTVEGTIFQKF